MTFERLFLAVPQGCLRFVIVVFHDHTHLLFLVKMIRCNITKTSMLNFCNFQRIILQEHSENVTTCLTELAKKHVPNKTIICRPPDPPWPTTYIRKLIRKRKQLFNKFKKSQNATDFDNYKTFRNMVTNEIRKSKEGAD